MCGPGCKEDGKDVASKAGAKVGETLTGFAAGVGKGMDKQMAVNVELAPARITGAAGGRCMMAEHG